MTAEMTLKTLGPNRAPATFPPAQRIFVVEDDEDARDYLVGTLLDDGHEVIALEDGAQLLECLAIIARESMRPPDLIATDVCMPGPSGIEVLESLRGAGWRTPVVLMTAFASPDLCFRVEKAGAAVVMPKPFELSDLRDAARRAGEMGRPRRDS